MKSVLITGGHGFLGRHLAQTFKNLGWKIIGAGRGNWQNNDPYRNYFDSWVEGNVCLELLKTLQIRPELIIHCAGGGAVSYSQSEPHGDFHKTVCSTAAVLEFARLNCPEAKLIYPSSPAVVGSHGLGLIKTTDNMNPVSSYGWHKKLAENLCEQYRNCYGLDVSIIRFFSIYGCGLRKQLLWDACQMFASGRKKIEFWGTGNETRDFIYIDDAVALVVAIVNSAKKNYLINGATGISHSIKNVLFLLRDYLGSDSDIVFNNFEKKGDPLHYQADVSEHADLNWSAKVSLECGIQKVANWFMKEIIAC